MTRILVLVLMCAWALPLAADEGKEATFLRQGESRLAAGDYRKAARAFEQAAELDPGSVRAQRGLGLAWFRLGANEVTTNPDMLVNAVAAFERALRLSPDLADVRYHLGLAYLLLDNKGAAVRECETLGKLDPKAAEALSARITAYRPPSSFRALGNHGDTAGDDRSFATPVTIEGNQVLVPVTFGYGSRSAQAVLLLDTGASSTSLHSDVASRLGIPLEQAPKTVGQVYGGALIEARETTLAYLTVGPHTRRDVPVKFVTHNGPPVRFDGLLGMDFLRNYRYHVDFTNQRIVWTK
jgi:tetratricopeptide (TPR) repeat protein